MSAHKRRAEDDLHNEQRLAKRFDLLNLEHNGKLYVPGQRFTREQPPPANQSSDESMQIDDTKDRVYIRNLDDELAEIDSQEEKVVFLPDIEEMLGKIPKSVLMGEGQPSARNEIVLYSVPTSLTVPEEQDKVRKAIIESRARAREKQKHTADGMPVNGFDGRPSLDPDPVHVSADHVAKIEKDEDAMDLE